MKYNSNILATIGKTPLIQVNFFKKKIDSLVLAKAESFNPGGSVKDRVAKKMVEAAEHSGALQPGGTIIELTSGNTGIGLALVAAVKEYNLICVVTDKISQEKINLMQAMRAQVRVCPNDVKSHDPRSALAVTQQLVREIPDAWWPNQYDNKVNVQTHYEETGPEIWEQTGGQVTHFVAGVGTGGTISGVGKFLKEKNQNIKVWGIEPYGSFMTHYYQHGVFNEEIISPYITEGIGGDRLYDNINFSVIDGFTQVTDRDAAVYTRKFALVEGILGGNSTGAAIKGILQLKKNFRPEDVVVFMLPDHGSNYLSKIFNQDWMEQQAFLEDNGNHY